MLRILSVAKSQVYVNIMVTLFRNLECPATKVSEEMRPTHIYRYSRPKFHAMLPQQLRAIGMEVVDYFEDTAGSIGGVILEDGSKHSADLVVAAGSVRGQSWPAIRFQREVAVMLSSSSFTTSRERWLIL